MFLAIGAVPQVVFPKDLGFRELFDTFVQRWDGQKSVPVVVIVGRVE